MYLKLLFLFIFNLLFFLSCSSYLNLSLNVNNEKINIEKPKISYKFNKLPKKINILFSDSNKDIQTKEFLKGLSVNYYYYKNLYNYQPEINYINLSELKKNKCNLSIFSKNYTIVFLNRNFYENLPYVNCLERIFKLKGIIVSLNSNMKVKNSNLINFNVERKEDYFNLLSYAHSIDRRDSMIIDDLNTKDKEALTKIWLNLEGNILSSTTSKDKQNEKLLSDLLLSIF